ncbi:MAG: hypothetical protein K8R77_11765, partial [Anaerolineaceae bacterium]|nr:hypothetical protein [Anaerolineaceae bacterium]
QSGDLQSGDLQSGDCISTFDLRALAMQKGVLRAGAAPLCLLSLPQAHYETLVASVPAAVARLQELAEERWGQA